MNIAEILKYCPKGTKLYSTAFGEVELINVYSSAGTILVQNINNTHFTFYNNGSYILDGECILFPSKDQRDWEEFRLPVKRGDIMMDGYSCAFITNGRFDSCNRLIYICGIDRDGNLMVSRNKTGGWTSNYIPASEEAKKRLFSRMSELGYKWNADTLELEKEECNFKVGDIVRSNTGYIYLIEEVINPTLVTIEAILYENGYFTTYHPSSHTTVYDILANEEERNKFHSALVKEGYKYDKWQHKLIKQEFKPFDKVLVRGNDTEFWKADIYLGYMKNNSCPYRCTKANYGRCVPYEGNEYLLDTANSPTWIDKKE